MEAGVGEVRIGSLMAMDPRGGQVELPGEHMKEPAFGLPATWIDDSLREEATFRGYTIVDPATVLTTHLTEILKDNMPDLLSYVELQKLVRDLPAEQKKLWDDIVPSVTSAATVQRVLQALLKERVSIRDLPAILEGVGEAAPPFSRGHGSGRTRPRPFGASALLGQSRGRRLSSDRHPISRLGDGLLRSADRSLAKKSSYRLRPQSFRRLSAAFGRPSTGSPNRVRPAYS